MAGSMVDSVMTADRLIGAERGAALAAELADLFPSGQLPRGRTIGCATGSPLAGSPPLASSRLAQGWWLAWALSRQLMMEGAWAVTVDGTDVGVEAAAALGIPLQRLVRVETSDRTASNHTSVDVNRWAEAVVAAADGVDIVITQPPPHAERLWRKVQQRIQARQIVVLTLGMASLATDFDIGFDNSRWSGVGDGHGHLAERRVTIRLGGRRLPRSRTVDLSLPDSFGALSALEHQPSLSDLARRTNERGESLPEVTILHRAV